MNNIFRRFIKMIAIIFSIPIYIILGVIVVLIKMIDEGLNTIIHVYKLWYETFVEEY